MSKNKILSNYLSKTYDKEENLEAICSKIKTHEIKKKKLLNIAAVLILLVLFGSVGTNLYAKRLWDIEYKEFQKRDAISISAELNNSYAESLSMDYLYQDGIGVKLDSITTTNDYFQMTVNFKFDDYTKIDTENLGFGYAIYDENNNIYDISERLSSMLKNTSWHYERKLCRELGIEYKPSKFLPHHFSNGGTPPQCIFSEDGNLIFQLDRRTFEGFPNSKKLFIRIFDIGFTLEDYIVDQDGTITYTDAENFSLSDNEWQFEISVPEKFIQREIVNLELAQNIDGVTLKNATLSKTGLIINLEHTGNTLEFIENAVSLYDKEGNPYPSGGAGSYRNKLDARFDVSIDDLSKGIYLKLIIPELNIDETIELTPQKTS